MFKQKPFPFSLIVLAVLIGLHLAGSYYNWYWSYNYFEVIIHILAGLWVGSLFLWLASCLSQIDSMKEYRTKSFLIALVAAALVGVAWELLENFGHLAFINADMYSFNTAIDLSNDIIGGILAYLYFIRRTSLAKPIAGLHPFYDKASVSH